MLHSKSKSPNFDDRAADVPVSILLLHYTGMKSMQEAYDRLCDQESKVSAHYLIDEDGTVMDLVPERERAWHAGSSYWSDIIDINSASIGIEIVNPGHEFGYREFPPEQMSAVLALSQKILGRHKIKHVLGHSDVAPERKQDPGELFDWRFLAANGVGLWPDPTFDERVYAGDIANRPSEVEHLFRVIGYNPAAAYVDVVNAFHRHYYPERFAVELSDQVDVETVARLLALKRLQKESGVSVS